MNFWESQGFDGKTCGFVHEEVANKKERRLGEPSDVPYIVILNYFVLITGLARMPSSRNTYS